MTVDGRQDKKIYGKFFYKKDSRYANGILYLTGNKGDSIKRRNYETNKLQKRS